MLRQLTALLGGVVLCLATAAPLPSPPNPDDPDADAAPFFYPAEFHTPVLSPDGANLAFVARQEAHSKLYLLNLQTGQIRGLFDAGQGEVARCWWMGNDRVLIAGRGSEGNVYLLQNLTDHSLRPVSLLDGVPVEWITPLPGDTAHVVTLKWRRGFYAEQIDVTTNRARITGHDVGDPRAVTFSPSGEILTKAFWRGNRWFIHWRAGPDAGWQEAEGDGPAAPFWPIGSTLDGLPLVVAWDQGNTTALMTLATNSRQRTLVAQHPQRDIYHLLQSSDSHGIQGVRYFHPGQDDIKILNADQTALYARIAQSLPELTKRIVSSTVDQRIHVVQANNPTQPANYYLLDLNRGRLSKIGQQYSAKTLPPLGQVRFFEYLTRDGIKESGYLLQPPAEAGQAPYPTVLIPLDYIGQFAEQSDGFDAFEQYLAHRGIAVAHLAVRGTSGMGREFENAGNYRLIDEVARDYEDGLAFLARKGLTDPARVGLYGSRASGLIALRLAAALGKCQAVVMRDADTSLFNSSDSSWLTASSGTSGTLFEAAGGREAAKQIMKEFDPERFLVGCVTPMLVLNTTYYGAEVHSVETLARLRSALRTNKVPHEWAEVEVNRQLPPYHYEAVFASKAVRYFQTQFHQMPQTTK